MRVIILFILLSAVTFCFGQTSREWLEYADDAFERKDFATAATFYLKSMQNNTDHKGGTYPYEIKRFYSTPKKDSTTEIKSINLENKTGEASTNNVDPKTQYLTHQVAESFRLSNDYEKAEQWYERSVVFNLSNHPEDLFWYGEMLMKNGKYQKALQQFERYQLMIADHDNYYYKKSDRNLFSCELAESAKPKKTTTVTLADSILNLGSSNFGATYFDNAGTIIFSSARPGSTVSNPNTEDGNYVSDLYMSSLINEKWDDIKKLPEPVNTGVNEGAPCLSPDQTLLFFTRWASDRKDEAAIYVSRFLNGLWLFPMKLNSNVNVEGFKSIHPFVSADGTKLYYSSNRPGGKGGMDIWYSDIDETGNATSAVNISMINTSENEVTPFINKETKTLFFSSDGHIGFGGLDVYKSYASDTSWSSPRNLGLPINSSRDECYFIIDPQEQNGILTSDRKKCNSCATDFCFQIYQFKDEPININISGYVYNKETNQPITNALVGFKDVKGEINEYYLTTDEKGFYTSRLREDMDLFLKAQKTKYFADAAAITTQGIAKTTELKQNFYLRPIPAGDIEIPGIEYDLNKATLRPASKKILDELYDFLVLNDNIIIEISSHTDVRGSDTYNMKLSDERAKSVVDYLISKGIEKERLVSQGYGETKPIIVDAKTEEEHQRNRRTAFRTLSEDFKPTNKYKYIPKKN